MKTRSKEICATMNCTESFRIFRGVGSRRGTLSRTLSAIGGMLLFSGGAAQAQFLFDATKAEMAGNADWVIDADQHNLGVSSAANGSGVVGGGTESNPQRVPTPAASGITASTPETYWTGALSSWGVSLVQHGVSTIETLPYNGSITYGSASNPQDLSNYKVYCVCEPNILFTASEKTAIVKFVMNGGSLFMVSDHSGSDRNNDGKDSVQVWNDLLTNNGVSNTGFGFTFNSDDISPSASLDTNTNDPLTHGPLGTASSFTYNDGASLTLNTAQNATIGAAAWTSSSHTNSNAMAVYGQLGSGRFVAIGDSSPFDDGTGDPNDTLYPRMDDGRQWQTHYERFPLAQQIRQRSRAEFSARRRVWPASRRVAAPKTPRPNALNAAFPTAAAMRCAPPSNAEDGAQRKGHSLAYLTKSNLHSIISRY